MHRAFRQGLQCDAALHQLGFNCFRGVQQVIKQVIAFKSRTLKHFLKLRVSLLILKVPQQQSVAELQRSSLLKQ